MFTHRQRRNAALAAVAAGLVAWRLGSGGARNPTVPPMPAAPSARLPPSRTSPTDPGRPRTPLPPLTDEPTAPGEGADSERPSNDAEGDADVTARLRRLAQAAAAHVDHYCEVARSLSEVPSFEERADGPTRDAADFMAPQVSWVLDSGETAAEGALALPTAVVDRLGSLDEGWAGALSTDDLSHLDFTWLRQLQRFDRWSLSASSPFAAAVDGSRYDAPMPQYAQLFRWVKLRYARALQTGDLAQASAEVHHLAALVHGQGALLPAVIAPTLLKLDRQAFEAARRAGKDVTWWHPAADADLDTYRKLVRASHAFLAPGVDAETMRKALDCTPDPCAALGEAALLHTSVAPLLPETKGDPFWALVDDSTCDASVLDDIRASKPLDAKRAATLLEGVAPDWP